MPKRFIRLNVNALKKAQVEQNIRSDQALAQKLGLSTTQVWRAKLPISDERYNAPGNHFIAGVLDNFEEPFEVFFYLDERSEC